MAFAATARSESRVTQWVKHGLIGGVVAGTVFAMFEMIMAAILDGADAFFMPLRMIGGIALGAFDFNPAIARLGDTPSRACLLG